MATFEETIREQRRNLQHEISWWPNYLYHFTDIHHAASILEKGWLYGRTTAKQKQLTRTDAASHNVLNVTSAEVQQCGRLYMRPLTPTQYYSEGYKPYAVRHQDYKDANCPVPVFFLFDAAKTLSYPGVYFIEKGAAGRDIQNRKSGPEEFCSLPFDKIFHYGSRGYTSSIGQYRRTEVLRDGGFPLAGLLKKVVCRSPAEGQTLCSLLNQYPEYKHLVAVATPDISTFMFYRHGIYIKTVKALEDRARIEFNEATLRFDQNKTRKGGVPVRITAEIYWKDDIGRIIDRDTHEGEIDYKLHNAVNLFYRSRRSNRYQLEISLDSHLVFQGDLDLNDHDIIV